jgi:hypothetical protein
LPLAGFKKLSPLASTFLLLRQKKGTKEKATPERSKARNKINHLRRWGNSAAASVGGLKHSPLVATRLKPQTINFITAR